MPIQHAIWKVAAAPEVLTVSKLATEKDLVDMITARTEMISSSWMLIGRQAVPVFGRGKAIEFAKLATGVLRA